MSFPRRKAVIGGVRATVRARTPGLRTGYADIPGLDVTMWHRTAR